MAVFVFVHGGFYGGWCWQKLCRKLQARGHITYAPSLSGVGERVHLLDDNTDLNLHITDIGNLLFYEDLRNVVLCGHSYGGMVITGAADKMYERIGALVYLDAFFPEDGKSSFDYINPSRKIQFERLAETYGEGKYVVPVPVDRQKDRKPNAEWLFERSTPHPTKCMNQPIALTGEVNSIKNRIYLYCLKNTPSAFERTYHRLDDSLWEKYQMDAKHNLMLENTDETLEIMLRAAEMVEGG